MSNGTNTDRLGRGGSLEAPSILRRKPQLAREIRARRLAAPTRNQWQGGVMRLNDILKTIFAIIGVAALFAIVLILRG